MAMTSNVVSSDLRSEIDSLGPWFHNLHLPGIGQTSPQHHFGDFPRFKWLQIAPHLPADLTGARALDIGCNAGFYSFELAKRGATVLGLDVNEHYLRQARWAAEVLGLGDRVTFRRGSVYDVSRLREQFDIAVFMGVLYHLRYPLLALDGLGQLAPTTMIFQTLTYGDALSVDTDGARFQDRQRLEYAGWPKLAFIETEFAGDPTNWWVPNRACVQAMLRSAGFSVVTEPGDEIFLCRFDSAVRRGWWDESEFLAATGAG